ncbi:hypothetical protein ND928_09680, partial [Vibrio diabolicus]|nr:hypothetical protein [Vibrio diabolicus]
RGIELDYHQRVPTQIDRSILLKSFPVELCSKQDGHFSELKFSVNHFFQTFFKRFRLANLAY